MELLAVSLLAALPGAGGATAAISIETSPSGRTRARPDDQAISRAGSVKSQPAAGATSATGTGGTGNAQPGGAPGPAPRTDAELMLDALDAAGVESPNARRIERALAEIRAESARKSSSPSVAWRDPFAVDPNRPVPVRQVGRARSRRVELALSRRDQARARAEIAATRAREAAAQAAAARARLDAAREEAAVTRAHAIAASIRAGAAKREAQMAEVAVVDPARARRLASERAARRMRLRGLEVEAAFTQSVPGRPAGGLGSQAIGGGFPAPDAVGPAPAGAKDGPGSPIGAPPAYRALEQGKSTGILVVPITH